MAILLYCVQCIISGANGGVGFGTYIPLPRAPDGNPCVVVIQDYIKKANSDQMQTMTPQNLQKDGDNTKKDTTITPDGSIEEEEVDATVMSLSKLGRKRKHPAGSCSEIRDIDPSASSRNYWLKGESESDAGKIYCDYDFMPPPTISAVAFNSIEMEVGWMRLLDFDMRRAHSHCPEGLLQLESPIKACANSDGYGCNSFNLSTHGVPYQRVCGMASGYQYNTPDAFLRYDCPSCENNINEAYLDGVSITYGSPRTHIWSYAAAWSEDHPSHPVPPKCPCADGTNLQSPEFVGQDYYCEQGDDNELWDGKECKAVEWSCCQHPDLPWFCKELPEPTTQDIEVRFCIDQGTDDENVFVEMMQLFVQ